MTLLSHLKTSDFPWYLLVNTVGIRGRFRDRMNLETILQWWENDGKHTACDADVNPFAISA